MVACLFFGRAGYYFIEWTDILLSTRISAIYVDAARERAGDPHVQLYDHQFPTLISPWLLKAIMPLLDSFP